MPGIVRLMFAWMCLAALCAGFVGCGGSAGPPDTQFEMKPAEIQLANDVRSQVQGIEQGADLKQVGQMLVENLQGMIEQEGAQSHKETYQKILDAAQKLAASGDAAQLAEIKKLADTLPKE